MNRDAATLLWLGLGACASAAPRAAPTPWPGGDAAAGAHLVAHALACPACHPAIPTLDAQAAWDLLLGAGPCAAAPRWRTAPDELLADAVAGLTGVSTGAATPIGPDPDSGEGLARLAGCTTCHGEALEGASGPRLPRVRGWTGAAFRAALVDGVGADGHRLSSDMPSSAYAGLTPTEVDALWTWTWRTIDAREALP